MGGALAHRALVLLPPADAHRHLLLIVLQVAHSHLQPLTFPLELGPFGDRVFQLAAELLHFALASLEGLLQLAGPPVGLFQVAKKHLLLRGGVIQLLEDDALLALQSLHELLQFEDARLEHLHGGGESTIALGVAFLATGAFLALPPLQHRNLLLGALNRCREDFFDRLCRTALVFGLIKGDAVGGVCVSPCEDSRIVINLLILGTWGIVHNLNKLTSQADELTKRSRTNYEIIKKPIIGIDLYKFW